MLRTVRQVVDHLAEDRRRGRLPEGELEGPLWVERGALRIHREDGLFRRRIVREIGSVYVMSVVRRPGDGSPERIVTVAVHVNVGPGSRTAVEAVREVLPQLTAALE